MFMKASYVSSSSKRQAVKLISAKTEVHTAFNYVSIPSDIIGCFLTNIKVTEKKNKAGTLEVLNSGRKLT